MHTEMWANAATRANVRTLESRGVILVGPASGQLTGTDSGAGRMSEPADIVAVALDAAIAANPDLDRSEEPVLSDHLAGRKVLISAGGTREPLDPVRFLGNASTGTQGVALAAAARDRGAEVVLIAANLEVPEPVGVRIVKVGTAQELLEAAGREAADADLVIMAAAVADYRPLTVAETKLKKDVLGDEVTLELVRNPDILAALAAGRPRPSQVVVGFAAETESDTQRLLALGREKIARKGADFLVLNEVGFARGFGPGDTAVTVIDRYGTVVGEAHGAKTSVAAAILDLVAPA
jgi:phosphopantothenoylcysteine decarboxylase/phosphopantothenate--cysteine ligase